MTKINAPNRIAAMMLEILKEAVNFDCRPPQAIETGKIPAASKIWRTITTANKSVAMFAVVTMSWVFDKKSILFILFCVSYGDDHISLFLPCFDIPVSFGSLFQRIASINHRFDLPRFNQLFEEN